MVSYAWGAQQASTEWRRYKWMEYWHDTIPCYAITITKCPRYRTAWDLQYCPAITVCQTFVIGNCYGGTAVACVMVGRWIARFYLGTTGGTVIRWHYYGDGGLFTSTQCWINFSHMAVPKLKLYLWPLSSVSRCSYNLNSYCSRIPHIHTRSHLFPLGRGE